jgi:hypothetical protein
MANKAVFLFLSPSANWMATGRVQVGEKIQFMNIISQP